MNLVEYLKSRGGTKTFYHVIHNKDHIKFQIQLESDGATELAEDVIEAVYGNKNPNIFVFNTTPSDYIEVGKESVTDISVLSLSEEYGKRQFELELGESEKHRRRLLSHLEHELMPFLDRLKEIEEINGLILRGDLVDPRRYPNRWSDINITAILNFWHYEKEKIGRLINFLKACPGTVIYSAWEFDFKYPSFYAKGEFLIENPGGFAAYYDLISLPSVSRLSEKLRFSDMPYFRRNYSLAKVLYDNDGVCEEFLKIMTGKSTPLDGGGDDG